MADSSLIRDRYRNPRGGACDNAASRMSLLVTCEFEVPEADRDKLDKLIAYARRLGIVHYALDSHDPNDDLRSAGWKATS